MQGHRELLHGAGPRKKSARTASQSNTIQCRQERSAVVFFKRTLLSTTKPLAIRWRGALVVVYSVRKEGPRVTMNQKITGQRHLKDDSTSYLMFNPDLMVF